MPSHTSPIRAQLLRESEEMVSYALASGVAVPPPVLNAVESFRATESPTEKDLATLAGAHQRLCKLVAPATPRALVIFSEQASSNTLVGQFGPIKLVRQMMGVALVSLLCFILLNTAHYWVASFKLGSASDLLTGEILWLAAAALGASFAILFQVNDFVVNRNYDPKYEPSYWIKFILGAIAGFILAALIPMDAMVSEGQAGGAAGGAEAGGLASKLAKPTLALLGGYSASAVYRILNRLITAVESLFRGDPREEMAVREQAAAARNAAESGQSRLTVASQLVELRHQIAAGGTPEEISRQVNQIVRSLMPSPEDPAPAPAAQPDAAPPAAEQEQPAQEPQPAPAEAVSVPAIVDGSGTVVAGATAPVADEPANNSASTP